MFANQTTRNKQGKGIIGSDETLTVKKDGFKTSIVLATIAAFFIFAASFSQGIAVASQTMPTPTLTPASTLHQTITHAANPESAYLRLNFTEFGYSAVGKYCSDMPIAKTMTLCNYTTPSYSGKIMRINIFLVGSSEVSRVRAVIFANEPNVDFPSGGEPVALSFESLNVTSISGQWYNFTMDYSASPNTVYWLGYYSDNLTHYFFDESNSSITVTSQSRDGATTWLPVGWSHQGKTAMSIYTLYTYDNSSSSKMATQTNSANYQSTQSYWDAVFVLLIISGETAILLPVKNKRKIVSAR